MIRDAILHVFFPLRCPVCDRPLRMGEMICPGCEDARIRNTGGARCAVCGLPVRICACGVRLFYDKVCFPFFYEDEVRRTLQKLKFSDRQDLARMYAAEMLRAAAERDLLRGVDVISFVPMRKKAERRRGYNQARLLAEEVGRQAGLPVAALLDKIADTATQHDLRLSRRRGNVLGAFEPAADSQARIEGKTILLTDDIVTSGNTLNEAAKTLMIFGAERVVCLCAAGARKRADRKNEGREEQT